MKAKRKLIDVYSFVRPVTHDPQTGQELDSPYIAYRYVEGKCKEALTKEQIKNAKKLLQMGTKNSL